MTLVPSSLPALQPDRIGVARASFRSGHIYAPSSVALRPEQARSVADHCDRILERMTTWSGLAPIPQVQVMIDPGRGTPAAYLATDVPVILVPLRTVEQLDGDDLQPDLVHEFAHVLLFAPRSAFLAEGWAVACSYALSRATYFPFPMSADAPTLHRAVALQPGPAWRLGDYFQNGSSCGDLVVHTVPNEANRLAYGRAGAFVQYLLAEHGVPTFAGMVRAFNDDPAATEESVLARFYGGSLEEIEARWRARCDIPAVHGPVDDPPAAPGSCVPISGFTGWMLFTDQVLQGNSDASLGPEGDGFVLEGKIGNRGTILFVEASRFLYGQPSPTELRPCAGLRFEARGDGKNYQIAIATEAAWEPGKEFMYLLATRPEWTHHEIPFAQFHRFMATEGRLCGEQIVALHVRAFGYRNQAVRLAMRGIEFYV